MGSPWRVVRLCGPGARPWRWCEGRGGGGGGDEDLARLGAVLTAAMVTLSAGGHGRGKALVPHPQEPKTGPVTGSRDLCRVVWL